jgi:hypothetical protein
MSMYRTKMTRWLVVAAVSSLLLTLTVPAGAHPDDGGGHEEDGSHDLLVRPSASDALAHHDVESQGIVSDGPGAPVIKNLTVAGRGVRTAPDATTDVWAHGGYAYTGTFGSPCGGEDGAGVWIWDTSNKNKVTEVGVIDSPVGSRSNDVKVAAMNSGDVLVHSNESCGGGPGGFEIYDVNDPAAPVLSASVRIDELNAVADGLFGGLTDLGVHNLWLFTQGANDYVGVVSEGVFDNFRIYDITDPTAPVLAEGWGAEELFDPGVGDSADVNRVLSAALWLLDGVGASANRFLHDATISADGQTAYLSNWDAGLVRLDISDPSAPSLVSVALDVANGSLDGELNSHSAWPNGDGSVVVEGEEDFSAWEGTIPPSNLTMQNLNTIPGAAASTTAGDTLSAVANQTTNAGTLTSTSLSVTSGPLNATTFPVVEFTGNNVPLGAGSVSGNIVWVGSACNGDPLDNPLAAGDIAVVRRGACFFSDKEANVAAAGASAIVITNNQASTPWSGLRIWDYSDPANPVLASTFDTTCSASIAPGGTCDPAGTYSSHNVLVEGNKAYVSWYSDGVLVLDISDPYNPVEVARYSDQSAAFQAQNGGPQDVWGIYKIQDEPWIYASDRNGGLYILKEYGSGSAKNGR